MAAVVTVEMSACQLSVISIILSGSTTRVSPAPAAPILILINHSNDCLAPCLSMNKLTFPLLSGNELWLPLLLLVLILSALQLQQWWGLTKTPTCSYWGFLAESLHSLFSLRSNAEERDHQCNLVSHKDEKGQGWCDTKSYIQSLILMILILIAGDSDGRIDGWYIDHTATQEQESWQLRTRACWKCGLHGSSTLVLVVV